MKKRSGLFLCSVFLFFAQAAAYPQTGKPGWIRGRIPQNDTMLFFRGEAEGGTLEKAREEAKNDAYNTAANYFIASIVSERFENLISENSFDKALIDGERTGCNLRIESKMDLSGLTPVDEYREQTSKGFIVYVLYGIDRAAAGKQQEEVKRKLEQERRDEQARVEALVRFHAGRAKGAAAKAGDALRKARGAGGAEELKIEAAAARGAAREAQEAAAAAQEAATHNSLAVQIAVEEAKAAAKEADAAAAAAASFPDPAPKSPRQRGLAAFSPDEFGGAWSGDLSYAAGGRNYRDAYVIELYEGGACWVAVRAGDGTTQAGEGHWSADNGVFRLDCGFENPAIARLAGITWLSVYNLQAGGRRLRINIKPSPDASGVVGITLTKGVTK